MSGIRRRRAALAAVTLAAAALVIGAPSRGAAHHILGIPHYSYDEDYPQTPVLTMEAQAGPYDVRMTAYPGIPTPGEPCYLNTYIRDRDRGVPYDGPVRLTVTRDRLLGQDPIIYGPMDAELSEAVYKFYPTFPDEASYTARLQLDVEGEMWTVEVPVRVGEPASSWGRVAWLVGGLLAALLIVRAVLIKARRLRTAPAVS